VRLREAAPAAQVALFSAASGAETSGPAPGGGSGLFTQFLVQALGTGAADIDGDGQSHCRSSRTGRRRAWRAKQRRIIAIRHRASRWARGSGRRRASSWSGACPRSRAPVSARPRSQVSKTRRGLSLRRRAFGTRRKPDRARDVIEAGARTRLVADSSPSCFAKPIARLPSGADACMLTSTRPGGCSAGWWHHRSPDALVRELSFARPPLRGRPRALGRRSRGGV